MKKLLALFLALMMMALPAMGMAASPAELFSSAADAGRPVHVEYSFEGGQLPLDENIAAILNDILNTLSFSFDKQEGDAPQTDLCMLLGGSEVLNIAVARKDDLIYVQSNVLGADALAFTAEEGLTIIERLTALAVDSGSVTQSEADAYIQQVEALISGFAAESAVSQLDSFDLTDMDISGLLSYYADLAERIEISQVSGQPKNCDTAATVVTYTLTGEDIAEGYNQVFGMIESSDNLMTQLDQVVKAVDGTYTAKELLETMNDATSRISEVMEGDVPVTIYLDEAGLPVYATASFTMRMEESSDDVLNGSIDYTRLTVNEGVTHNINVIATRNGDTGNGASVSLAVLQGEKRSTLDFSVSQIIAGVTEGEAINVNVALDKDRTDTTAKDQLTFCATVTEDNGNTSGFVVTADIDAEITGEDAVLTAAVKPYIYGEEKELLTLKVNASTGSAKASIVTEDAARPGQMDDEAFNTLLVSVVQSAQVALVSVLQNMPTSVLQLLN